MTKTGTADLMKCASKIHFRTRRVRYTSRRQVLDHSRPKGKGPVIIYQIGGWAILGVGGGHEKYSTPNGGSKFHL